MTRTAACAALLLVALSSLFVFAEEPAAKLQRVDLIQLGASLSDADVAAVKEALVTMYGVEVRVRSASLPKAAWYAPRKRWRAEKILAWMQTLPLDGADHLLGLTGVDISTTKEAIYDWGVLGLGSIDGTVGVLSRFRCGRDGVSTLHARQRLAKVAVHELGHTLGLEHCAVEGCLMHDAEGKVASCDVELDLCARCRGLLAARGLTLPAVTKLPWPPR